VICSVADVERNYKKMIMKKNFEIFISYRRSEGGFETANIIHDRLTRSGYKVFMDVENLRSGKFNEQLYNQIDNCKDFIVVLGPRSLERCKNEDDWLRLEISHAIKKEKNIIPVFLRNFTIPEDPLPKDISELLNFEGIEASHVFFNAFLEKLKKLLLSKRHFTWKRIKRQILLFIIPVLILIATLLFIHYYNQKQEKTQLENVCKEVTSEISCGFIRGNDFIGIIKDVNKYWHDFHLNLNETKDPKFKNKLKSEFCNYINMHIKTVKKSNKLLSIELTSANQELLARNNISVEDIKGANLSFQNDYESVLDYLEQMIYWVNSPQNSWPFQIDEAFDILAEVNIEMINCNIYAFNELLIQMPHIVEDSYNKFLPHLTNYSAEMDFLTNKTILEAKQNRSFKKINQLINEYSSIIGNENIRVSRLESELNSFKKAGEKINIKVLKSPKIDSLKNDITNLNNELEVVNQKLKVQYQKILIKCSFDKNESMEQQMGKILHLVKYGYNKVLLEYEIILENERRKKELIKAGLSLKNYEPMKSPIASNDVLKEVFILMDKYVEFNKKNDPNVMIYIPLVKEYYKLVYKQIIEPVGIVILGTEKNIPHPVLKIGDIIVEKKGMKVKNLEDYSNASNIEGENKQIMIRFIKGKKTIVTGIIPPDCKVLFSAMNLWEE